MIQRKQTIFLLLAIVSLIACLCLPIGAFAPKTMGVAMEWFNLGQYTKDGFQFNIIPFALLALAATLSTASIFIYKQRKSQARLCVVNIVLCALWYAQFAAYVWGADTTGTIFQFRFAACLPLVAIILLFMARSGIMADERLVRSMDRIR